MSRGADKEREGLTCVIARQSLRWNFREAQFLRSLCNGFRFPNPQKQVDHGRQACEAVASPGMHRPWRSA